MGNDKEIKILSEPPNIGGWDTVPLKIRLNQTEADNVNSGNTGPNIDLSVRKAFTRPVQVVDVEIETDANSDAALIKTVVAQHFKKIFARADAAFTDSREFVKFRPQPDQCQEDGQKSLADQRFETAALNPEYLRIKAAPSEDTANTFSFIPFSTVGFLDSQQRPYILISRSISFQAAIICAFNSVLDLINIFGETRVPTRRQPRQQVFHGLNSQKVQVEFNNALCPGYLRTSSPLCVF